VSSTPFTTLKIVVAAPMPNANVNTTTAVNPSERCIVRTA
jgi:hypothetical protein